MGTVLQLTTGMKIRCSSADRVVNCPGSVRYNLESSPSSDAANEGTVAHYYAALALREGMSALPESLPDEMIDGIGVYHTAAYIFGAEPEELHIEEKVILSEYNEGTPDCWWFDAANQQLHVWDFKYGHGFVDHYENWQLINYAAGIKCDALAYYLHIVQPRCYAQPAHRTWILSKEEFTVYNYRMIVAYGVAASDGRVNLSNGLIYKAPTRVGKHCKYCQAVPTVACPALQAEFDREIER